MSAPLKLVLQAPLRGLRAPDACPAGAGDTGGGEPPVLVDALAEERAARAAERAALQRLAEGLERAAASLEASLAERLDGWARWIVELALETAGLVLRSEVDGGRYDLTPSVKEAVERVLARDGGAVLVQLHPEDLSRVVEGLDAASKARIAKNVHFETDPSLERGAFRLDTGLGRFEHDPREYFERIAAEIRSRFA